MPPQGGSGRIGGRVSWFVAGEVPARSRRGPGEPDGPVEFVPPSPRNSPGWSYDDHFAGPFLRRSGLPVRRAPSFVSARAVRRGGGTGGPPAERRRRRRHRRGYRARDPAPACPRCARRRGRTRSCHGGPVPPRAAGRPPRTGRREPPAARLRVHRHTHLRPELALDRPARVRAGGPASTPPGRGTRPVVERLGQYGRLDCRPGRPSAPASSAPRTKSPIPRPDSEVCPPDSASPSGRSRGPGASRSTRTSRTSPPTPTSSSSARRPPGHSSPRSGTVFWKCSRAGRSRSAMWSAWPSPCTDRPRGHRSASRHDDGSRRSAPSSVGLAASGREDPPRPAAGSQAVYWYAG